MSPEDHGVINKTVRLLPLFHRVISGAVAPQTEEEQVSDDYSEGKKKKKKIEERLEIRNLAVPRKFMNGRGKIYS